MFDRPGPHRDYATLLASAESGDADAAYEMATKLDIEFYQDGRDALLKALAD